MLRVIKFFKDMSWTFLAPLVTVSIAALILFILGAIPPDTNSGGMRDYSSIEAAESDLGFNIEIPSYFPNYLSWPPDKISGQHNPVLKSEMTFVSFDRKTEVMVISQIASSADNLPVALPWVDSILQETETTISGNKGELIVGKKSNGITVNGVYWKTAEMYFAIITTRSSEEAIIFAQSMRP